MNDNTAPARISKDGPFAAAAEAYYSAGWYPLPVEAGTKRIAVGGYTGRDGKWPGTAELASWVRRYSSRNIAVRMPVNVAGIDVDAYDGKAGAETLARLEREYGELPVTYLSTSRGNGISGIRLFRVPPWLSWKGKAGPGIDIISWHYRYALVWPSRHPETGREYRAYYGSAEIALGTPDGLPRLPAAWEEFLRNDAPARSPAGGAQPVMPEEWLNARPGGEMCELMRHTSGYWCARLAGAGEEGGAHDEMVYGVNAAIRDSAAGHTGIREALRIIWNAFRDAVSARRRIQDMEEEWKRAVRGAIQNAEVTGDSCNCAEVADMENWKPHRRKREAVKLAPVPEFPAESLIGPLRQLVDAAGHLPAPLVAGAGLAALSGLCGNAELEMPDSTFQYPALWIPLIAPSGGGKTPALNLAFREFRDLETDSREKYHRALREWNNLPKDARGEPPPDPALIIDDFTMESLARFLAPPRDGIATVLCDELAGFLDGLGRYNKGGRNSDQKRLLALWPCVPWSYRRVTGSINFFVPCPVVSIVGGIQPGFEDRLGDAESGMRARWLPFYSPATSADWASSAVRAEDWDEAIDYLYDHKLQTRTWRLKGEAERLWKNASKRWKRTAAGRDIPTSLNRALAKADVQAARIALALAESLDPSARSQGGNGGPIAADVMKAAVSIVDYVMDVWRALPVPGTFALTFRAAQLRPKVELLRAWLEEHGGHAQRREILQAKVAGVESYGDVDALCDEYQKVYPGTVRPHRVNRTGPVPVFVFAPEREGRNP